MLRGLKSLSTGPFCRSLKSTDFLGFRGRGDEPTPVPTKTVDRPGARLLASAPVKIAAQALVVLAVVVR